MFPSCRLRLLPAGPLTQPLFDALSADSLARALDSLCLDLKADEGKSLFLEYPAVPVVLSHLRVPSKGLLSCVVNSLPQTTVESSECRISSDSVTLRVRPWCLLYPKCCVVASSVPPLTLCPHFHELGAVSRGPRLCGFVLRRHSRPRASLCALCPVLSLRLGGSAALRHVLTCRGGGDPVSSGGRAGVTRSSDLRAVAPHPARIRTGLPSPGALVRFGCLVVWTPGELSTCEKQPFSFGHSFSRGAAPFPCVAFLIMPFRKRSPQTGAQPGSECARPDARWPASGRGFVGKTQKQSEAPVYLCLI